MSSIPRTLDNSLDNSKLSSAESAVGGVPSDVTNSPLPLLIVPVSFVKLTFPITGSIKHREERAMLYAVRVYGLVMH